MKTKSLFIMLACLLTSMKAMASYGDTFTVNESDYSITYMDVSDSSNPLCVAVSAFSNKTSSNIDVVIPDEVTNNGSTYRVIEIGERAVKSKRVSKVTLPTGLLRIGYEAFYGNPLTQVVIPATVHYVGADAFANCTSLTKVYWYVGDENNWNPIGMSDGKPTESFNNCTSLTDIYLMGTRWDKISTWPMQPSGTTTVNYWVASSITSMKSNVTGVLKNYTVSLSGSYYVGRAEPFGIYSSSWGTGWSYPQDGDATAISQEMTLTAATSTGVDIDNVNKLVICKKNGSARIDIAYRGTTLGQQLKYVNDNTLTSLSFDPSSTKIQVGETCQQMPNATANYEPIVYFGGTWTSSNTDIATVSSEGVVTGVGAGEATITLNASNFSGTTTASYTVKVIDPDISNLKLNGGETTGSVNLDKGVTTFTLTPSFDTEGNKEQVTLTWASDNTSVATISTATSLGEAEKTVTLTGTLGTANIICSHPNADGTVEKATIKLTVFRPTVSSLAFSKDVYQVVKGSTVSIPITFNADVPKEDVKITYSFVYDGSGGNASFEGGTTLMGDVTNTVKGTTNGTVTIKVRHIQNDGTTLQATAKVIVANSFADSFTLDPSSQMMSPGETVKLTPKATGSGVPSSPSYTWKSSNTAVATVSNGTVTAKGFGSALITCTMGSTYQEATCQVTVRDPDLINVGTFFYKRRSDATLEVTNCAGGKPSNLTDDCFGYSGSVIIPAEVTYGGATYTVSAIGEYAFYNQIDLQGLTIPASIQELDASSCEGAKNLAAVSFDKKGGLLSIGDRAFYGCKKLDMIRLPKSTLSIGKSAFQSCDALEAVELSTSLNIIGDYAFADCPLLNEIDLPETNLNIQTGAFQNDIALTEITLPAGLQGLGASAFSGCSALEEVTFNTESDQAFTVGEDAFAGTAVKRVNIANLDSWIQTNFSNPAANPASISHHIYQDGAEIINALVPEGPSVMNNNAFYGCSSLKTLQLPSTLEQVNDNTLYGCTALETVYVRATFVPRFIGTGDPSLMDDVFNKAELCVPSGKESKYRNDSKKWWSRFKTITGSVTDAQCATPTIAYSGGKLVFGCETEGVDYVYSVRTADAKNGSGNNVEMSAVYNVSVYATKAGLANSEIATLDIPVGGGGSGLKGDVNMDGQVTITDAVAVVDIILNGK